MALQSLEEVLEDASQLVTGSPNYIFGSVKDFETYLRNEADRDKPVIWAEVASLQSIIHQSFEYYTTYTISIVVSDFMDRDIRENQAYSERLDLRYLAIEFAERIRQNECVISHQGEGRQTYEISLNKFYKQEPGGHIGYQGEIRGVTLKEKRINYSG